MLTIDPRSTFEANTLQWVSQRPQNFAQGSSSYGTDASETQRMESANTRGLDSVLTLQTAARRLETNLGIDARWGPDSEDWKRVDKSWSEREFDKAVDRLEGLVIARIFELEKMNGAHRPASSLRRRKRSGKRVLFQLGFG